MWYKKISLKQNKCLLNVNVIFQCQIIIYPDVLGESFENSGHKYLDFCGHDDVDVHSYWRKTYA